jgi:hypothetical protein
MPDENKEQVMVRRVKSKTVPTASMKSRPIKHPKVPIGTNETQIQIKVLPINAGSRQR